MEIWDLYTADREKTKETITRGERLPDGRFHLVVHACIFNANGEMLIQRRQPFKHGWSGLWDITVGGSAVAGDSSSDAVARELFEELGIRYDFEGLRPALTVHFPDGFDDVYLVKMELDPATLTLQHEEVAEIRWASEEEILSMIDNRSFIPYHKSFIEALFFLKDHNGFHTTNDFTAPTASSH